MIINMVAGVGDELGKDLISNQTLQDTIQETVVKSIQDWLSNLWQWSMGASFWIACIGCVILLILYATTLDKKYSRKASVLFVLYLILKGIDVVI